MDMGTWLMAGVLTGALGAGYFVYGKKTHRPVPLVAGILLCVYPYFISSLFWLILVGVVLAVVPFFIRYDP